MRFDVGEKPHVMPKSFTSTIERKVIGGLYVELELLPCMRPFGGLRPTGNKTVRPMGQSRQFHACVWGGALHHKLHKFSSRVC